MVVALTVTPALALILLRNAPLERPRVAARARGCKRGYRGAPGARSSRGRGRRIAVVGRASRGRHRGLRRCSGQSLLPDVQGARLPDALGDRRPGTSAPEEARITDRGQPASCARSRASATSAPTSARPSWPTRSSASNFGENWISIDPHGRLRQDARRASRRSSTATRACYRDVQTYLQGADRRGADRRQRADRRPHLRRRPARPARARPRRSKTALADDRRASSTCTRRARRSTSRRSRSRSTWPRPQRYGLKPGDVRRAAATLVAGEEVGDIFSGGKAYDVHVWSTPGDAPQRDRHRRAADRHADRRAGAASATSPTCASRRRRTSSRARTPRARSTSTRNVEGRDLGSVVARRRGRRLRAVEFPLGYHAELLGEYAERQAAQDRLLLFARRRCDRDLPAAAGVLRQLAAGDALASSRCRSALVGGVLAAYAQRRRPLARLARRLPHGARHRRAQRHHADQPLPAPRARRGRDVRPGARAARRARSGSRRS